MTHPYPLHAVLAAVTLHQPVQSNRLVGMFVPHVPIEVTSMALAILRSHEMIDRWEDGWRLITPVPFVPPLTERELLALAQFAA